MPEYLPVPEEPPPPALGLFAAWYHAALHIDEIKWVMGWIPHAPFLELEPPRRPPSWYPGQPDPPRPRIKPCTCMYVLTDVPDAPGPWLPIKYPGRRTVWVTRCFVIVFDCPHHGDARYDPELLRGYTPEGEALFWETLAEDERRP